MGAISFWFLEFTGLTLINDELSRVLVSDYRNAVNKERKLCKAKYYTSKVQDLKGVNPRLWWKEVN